MCVYIYICMSLCICICVCSAKTNAHTTNTNTQTHTHTHAHSHWIPDLRPPARINRIILIGAGIQDPRSKIVLGLFWVILDSWILDPSPNQNDLEMIRMIRATWLWTVFWEENVHKGDSRVMSIRCCCVCFVFCFFIIVSIFLFPSCLSRFHFLLAGI